MYLKVNYIKLCRTSCTIRCSVIWYKFVGQVESATVTFQIKIIKRWYQMLQFLPKRWQYIRGKANFQVSDVKTSNLRICYPRKTELRVSNDTFSLTGLHVLAILPALSSSYGYKFSFLGIKRPELGFDHISPYRTGVKTKNTAVLLHHVWALMTCHRINFTYNSSPMPK